MVTETEREEERELQSSNEDENEKEEEEEEEEEEVKKQRVMCWEGCGRPKRVCLCPFLPPAPIHTKTSIFILHHPHQLKSNRLSTVPLLPLSLSNLHLRSSRRLSPLSFPSLLPSSSPVLFLFPFARALDLAAWARATPLEARARPALVLVDGTWGQAREMALGSMKFLDGFATCVSLGCKVEVEGEGPCETDLALKKEPFEGCMSTIEAVARALRILEPEETGREVEASLLKVLRGMVGFQASFMKPMKPRPKMVKKKKVKDQKGNDTLELRIKGG